MFKGFNDLATKYPEIAIEAHGWDPSTFTPGAAAKKLGNAQRDIFIKQLSTTGQAKARKAALFVLAKNPSGL